MSGAVFVVSNFRLRPQAGAVILLSAALACFCGCVGGDAKGIETKLAGFEQRNSVKVENTRKIFARDIQENSDKILMRILGAGFVLMGLSYPAGKLLWIMSQKAAKQIKIKAGK